MNPKTKAVMEMIAEERQRQDAKWGPDRVLTPMLWLTILMEEVGEVARAILERDWANLLIEIVQVAAVAVAWLEMFSESVDTRKKYD